MASTRVQHVLEEIARLTQEEQAELMQDLPRVLQSGRGAGSRGGLSAEALQRALETHERIRQRLETAQQSPGSINEDVEDVRNDRLDELDGSVRWRWDEAQ